MNKVEQLSQEFFGKVLPVKEIRYHDNLMKIIFRNGYMIGCIGENPNKKYEVEEKDGYRVIHYPFGDTVFEYDDDKIHNTKTLRKKL